MSSPLTPPVADRPIVALVDSLWSVSDARRVDSHSPWVASAGKRAIDLVAATLGLLLLSPLFGIVAILVKLDSAGPVFFRQSRIGQQFRPFQLCKFRTMYTRPPTEEGLMITPAADPRITRLGRVLRKTKIDELPQLLHVIGGEMSLVGPRPQTPRYVRMFDHDYQQILAARPGITDLSSLTYRDEAAVLAACEDPDREYITRIHPEKLKLQKEYLRRASLWLDVVLIAGTLRALCDLRPLVRRALFGVAWPSAARSSRTSLRSGQVRG